MLDVMGYSNYDLYTYRVYRTSGGRDNTIIMRYSYNNVICLVIIVKPKSIKPEQRYSKQTKHANNPNIHQLMNQ